MVSSEEETTRPLMQARDPLVGDPSPAALTCLRLYDPTSTLLVRREVAEGYLVLLSGGLMTAAFLEKKRAAAKKAKKGSLPDVGSSTGESSSQELNNVLESGATPDSAIHLAFVSLTDGNVIDSVFGVQTHGGTKRSKDTSAYAFNASRSAKDAIRDAADSSESIPRLAVETYQRCFETVIEYHNRIDDLGLITYCYKHQAVEKEALDDLEEVFIALLEAVEAAA